MTSARMAGVLLAGGGGALVGASTFLDWFRHTGIEGAYFNKSVGAPAYAGIFDPWSDAWESFGWLRYALVAVAGLGVLLALWALTDRADRRPATMVAAVSGTVLLAALISVAAPPDGLTTTSMESGGAIGLFALAAVASGAGLLAARRPPERRTVAAGLLGAGGLALLGSLFLPWYEFQSAPGTLMLEDDDLNSLFRESGWQLFSAVDISLGATAGVTMVVALTVLRRASLRHRIVPVAALAWTVAAAVITVRMIDPPERDFGPGEVGFDPVYGGAVALAALLMAAAGAWIARSEEAR